MDTTTNYRFGVRKVHLKATFMRRILFHFDPAYEGQRNKIWLEIRNDTLIHIFPVNDVGEPNKTRHWVEKYVKFN